MLNFEICNASHHIMEFFLISNINSKSIAKHLIDFYNICEIVFNFWLFYEQIAFFSNFGFAHAIACRALCTARKNVVSLHADPLQLLSFHAFRKICMKIKKKVVVLNVVFSIRVKNPLLPRETFFVLYVVFLC